MDYSTLSQRIPLEGTINTRDLGGYVANDGRRIKYKRIIRTDALYNLTDKDIAFLKANYDPRVDIDFRRPSEIAHHPDKPIPGVAFFNYPVSEEGTDNGAVNPHPPITVPDPDIARLITFIYVISKDGDVTKAMEGNYRRYISSAFSQKHYSLFLKELIKNKEGSVLYHCADGKDRAGIGTVIFLLALGIPQDAVLYDYLKTNDNTKGKRDWRENYLKNVCHYQDAKALNSVLMLAGVRKSWFDAAIDELNTKYWGIESYLTNQLGLSDSEIKALKDNYLE